MVNELKQSKVLTSRQRQNRLFGRAILVKEEKVQRQKEKTGLSISHLTNSMIKDYLFCPRLFYFKYILGLRLPMKSIQLVFGSSFHSALEGFYKKEDPEEIFMKEFLKEKIDPFNEEEYIEAISEGKRFVQRFIDAQDWLKTYHGIEFEGESEKQFKSWWRDPSTGEILDVFVSGRYDRVTKNHQLIDFKTSSKSYSQDKADSENQPSVYCFSYFLQEKIEPKEFIYIVFVKGRKDPLQVIKTKRTKEEYSLMFKIASLVLKGIKGKQFNQGNGFLHKYCDCYKYEKLLLL